MNIIMIQFLPFCVFIPTSWRNESTKVHNLGVTVQSNLSWSLYYDNICSLAYQSLGFIRHTIPSSSSVCVKRALYISLVRSKLSYCC